MPPKVIPYSALQKNVFKLPRLPIPPLQDTFRRYTESVTPLKKDAEVASHLAKLKTFAATTAPAQQRILIDYENACAAKEGQYPHSYIEKAWDAGYLAFRGPLAVNINPGLSFERLPQVSGQCEVAAAYITSILRFIKKVVSEGLDVPTDPPLDESQMHTQFCFARVPQLEVDRLSILPLTKAKHVAVLHRGHLHLVAVFDENGSPYSTETICSALKAVIASRSDDCAAPIGYLTAGGRNDWATTRNELISIDPSNETKFQQIEHAIIMLCLDATAYNDTTRPAGMLFGGDNELGNRWYDKHQLIVDAAGGALATFEHSYSDGRTWVRWMTEVIRDIQSLPSEYSPLPKLATVTAADPSSLVVPIDFKLGDHLAGRLRVAKQDMVALAKNVVLREIKIPFGTKFLKSLKISPDAFMQAAFHLAYYRQRGKMAPTYESCSTARFWHGRTETIRSGSIPMQSFVLAAANRGAVGSSSSREALRRMLDDAAQKHRSLSKEAQFGLGVDRHLLALKEVVKETRDPNGLAFFDDFLFGYSGTWLLSTSNVSSPHAPGFNFGAVTPDGYGIGYGINPDASFLGMSSFKASKKTNLSDLATGFAGAVEDLLMILGGKASPL